MSADTILFYVFAAFALITGLGVVTRKNPITGAMLLVAHFMMLAGLYLLLNAQFMAAIQVLVYAGAIMVLVVFVIMLLNLGREEKISDKLRSREAIGVLLVMVLGGALIFGFTRGSHEGMMLNAASAQNGTIQGVANALFTTYVFPFEMISLVLLAAAVGAVVLTKRKLV